MFTVLERSIGTAACLDLGGRLQGEAAEAQLKGRVNRLIEAGCRGIVLNVGEVTHVDSSGLGTIIAVKHRVERAGGRVALAGVGGRLMDLLVISALSTHFECFEREEEAERWIDAASRAKSTAPETTVGT